MAEQRPGEDARVIPEGLEGADVAETTAETAHDRKVLWRVFLGVGAIILILFAAYIPSNEAAGIVMLAVAAILGLWTGVFLWRATARLDDEDPDMVEDHLEFLPTSSPWPLLIGLGATIILNGLVIGVWFMVPGAMILLAGVTGFARQSRHRFDR